MFVDSFAESHKEHSMVQVRIMLVIVVFKHSIDCRFEDSTFS